jgi:hypothetical protein
MKEKELLEKLREKLDRNNKAFQEDWLSSSKSTLIEKASEIFATNTAYNELYGGDYPLDYLEYLLRFENPLEVVRDKWVEEIELPLDEEMCHVLWDISDKEYAEEIYELDEEYIVKGNDNEPLTVREFLKKHPDDNIQMMTPGGYVSLTPALTKALLSRDSVREHPGDPAYSVEIHADELLDQCVLNSNYSKHVWHLLAAEPEFDEGLIRGDQDMGQEMR